MRNKKFTFYSEMANHFGSEHLGLAKILKRAIRTTKNILAAEIKIHFLLQHQNHSSSKKIELATKKLKKNRKKLRNVIAVVTSAARHLRVYENGDAYASDDSKTSEAIQYTDPET